MTSTTLRLLALAFLAAANGLVVGGIGQRSAVSRPVQPRLPVPAMVSDKEFEEWARKKKIASGVDPDEDFGAGRRAESQIYVVGGAIPARHRLTLLACRSRDTVLCTPCTGAIAILVPTIAAIWAYNEGYLTPQ